jgi:hypothetical protein
MDRFPTETASEMGRNAARARAERIWGEIIYWGNVNVCENCLQSCEQLTHVEEYDMDCCDLCTEECMVALRKEAEDEAAAKKGPAVEGGSESERKVA